MTDIACAPILESLGTTYFDNLPDYGTESGKPQGELKIGKVPESSRRRNDESHGKLKSDKKVLEWIAIFYGEKQVSSNELKGSMLARAAE